MTTAPTVPGSRARAASPRPKKRAIKLPAKLREQGDNPGNRHWRAYFLAHLIETSNITASARAAGIATTRAYRTRHEDPDFAAQWNVALAQGYENLEMELLGYLRDAVPDRKMPDRKMDVANAIRLLTLHRQSVAHQRAHQDDRNEQEVLDSIDAMIDEMRARAAANAAQITDAGSTGHHG